MALNKDLIKLIKQKIALMENSPGNFSISVARSQKDLLTEALSLIGELDTVDGQIAATKANIKIIERIERDLKLSLYKSDYIKAVQKLVNEMEDVKKINDKYFSKEFGKYNKKQADIVYAAKKAETIDALMGESSVDAAFIKPVIRDVVDAVTTGSSYRELVDNIRTTVTGNAKKDAKLYAYSKQIATDAFATTERAYSRAIGQSIEAQFYFYTGGLVGHSRCFCIQRDGMYFHEKEIEAWGSGKTGVAVKQDCGFPWGGMRAGTNASTIFSFLGGYGCLHSIIPVSLYSVPIDVITRAINEGYLKLTEEQRILLSLN